MLHQVDAHDLGEPRAGDHLFPDRQRTARPAEHGRVGDLWARQRFAAAAGFRGDDFARQGGLLRTDLLRPLLGQRLLAIELPGRALPRQRRSGALSIQSGRNEPRGPARLARSSGATQRAALFGIRRPGDRHADRAVRDGLQDAGERAGADRLFHRVGRDAGNVWAGGHAAGKLRLQLPDGPPAGRARGAVHPVLPRRLGPPQQPQLAVQDPVPGHRRALRGAGQGPQAPRLARRHAGHLGRRVRPHAFPARRYQ